MKTRSVSQDAEVIKKSNERWLERPSKPRKPQRWNIYANLNLVSKKNGGPK